MDISLYNSAERMSGYEAAKFHELIIGKHSILLPEPVFNKPAKTDPDANWIFKKRNIDEKLEETSYFLHALQRQIRLNEIEDDDMKAAKATNDTDDVETNSNNDNDETKEALKALDELDMELMKDGEWRDEIKKEWINLQNNRECDDNVEYLNHLNETNGERKIIFKNISVKSLNEKNLTDTTVLDQSIINGDENIDDKDSEYVLSHYEQLQNWLLQLKHNYASIEEKCEPNYIALLTTAKRLSQKIKEGRVLAWLIARSENTPSKYRISLGSWFLANLPIVQGRDKIKERLKEHKRIVLMKKRMMKEEEFSTRHSELMAKEVVMVYQ
ncbi:hypothetical protein Ahia01_000616000, partial [Argonauta hians]